MTEDGALPAPPLSGIKVLDLSRVAAGPYCTMVLANLGADVIKIERPGVGDDSRGMDQSITGRSSGYYLGINNNKRSIALDLKSDEARAQIHALAKWADVFIENFRPGVIERLGYGYEDLSALNPRLVYCSISAFGSHGPLAERIGYDIIGQALSGIMDITGEPDRPPAKCGAPIADISTGAMAALGIVAALYHRTVTGEGQKVETSLVGGAVSLLSSYLPGRAMGTPFNRVGSAHNTLAPYQAFEGSDGRFFILAVGSDGFWQKMTSAIGATELADDPSYKANADRSRRRKELAEKLEAIFREKPAGEWVQLMTDAGVPASEIYTIDDVIAEPHFREIGLIEDIEHPVIGPIPMVVTPLAFSNAQKIVRLPPPDLDEHGEEVRALIDELIDSAR